MPDGNDTTDDVVTRCRQLILAGRAADAVEVLRGQPGLPVERRLRLVLGDAQRAGGDLDAALATYRQMDRSGDRSTDAAVAFRIGQVHHLRGEPSRALEVYEAADPQASPIDHAWLFVGRSTAHWLLGDAEDAMAFARAAGARATIAGDPEVRAAAHVAMALAVSLNGDPATVEEEYARAAGYAQETGDLVQLARIHANRSHHLLADARFVEAVEVAAAAAAVAEELGAVASLAVALENEAEGLLWLDRYDEAVDRCERALRLSAQIGTKRVAGALVGLAQIHLRRGCREQARAALEQALRLQDEQPDRQVRVPALAWLAIALLPEEVEQASRLARQALAEATGSARVVALLAAGRAAQARGDSASARDLADQAVTHARRRRERRWLAEALELRAGTVDGVTARAALREAQQIWLAAGAGHAVDRILVQLAPLGALSIPERVDARLALARLRTAGVLDPRQSLEPVRIVTFGRFEVLVDGVAVPAELWQSRRARELLRLLVCRRGRAVPRSEICELLWPDDDPDRTAHRLSVLLSIVRGVLGTGALIADQACVVLDPTRVEIDVEEFLADVRDAAALRERGADRQAAALLAEAVDSYVDEPFADAPYDDATTALRDEARSALLQALRLLAQGCHSLDDHDQAATHLRRLLGEDRYDEDAHRTLIRVLNRAGRHGQARLAATRYRSAMAEIGLRPAI
jgi:DNA-binding SARP family transcriptional activator